MHAGTQRAPAPSCPVRNTPWKIARFIGEAQVRWVVQGQTSPQRYGAWLRERMVGMGPAFIKLGQFLSTRSDIFDARLSAELARLQDNLDPVSFEEIRGTIEHALGDRPIGDVFASIDPGCLASASIGQVHRGVLVGGDEVVVKVQKPCVAESIRNDIETLRGMNRILAQVGNPRAGEFEGILTQYERFLSAELHYIQEHEAMERFRRAAEGAGIPLRVPRAVPGLCTDEVLVMEFVPSTKITNLEGLRARGVDTARVAADLIYVMLYMVIFEGLVHCDPHPGNLGVAADGEAIVLYDFGNTFALGKTFRDNLGPLVIAITQKDVDRFVDILIAMGVLHVSPVQAEADIERLDLRAFFASFFGYLETLDFAELRTAIQGQGAAGARPSIRFDPAFMSLFRMFSLLDGTCGLLDPSFNYIDALAPFTQSFVMGGMGLGLLEEQARRDLDRLRGAGETIRRTEERMVRMQAQVRAVQERTDATYRVAGIVALMAASVSHGGGGADWMAVAAVLALALWRR